MSFKSFYLSEVLGVKKYLCPKDVFDVRQVTGGLPCTMLVVVKGEVSLKENQLLHKIMQSIGYSEFTLLELKKVHFLESFMNSVEKEKLAHAVIFFGQELSYKKFKQVKCLNTYSLKELEGNNGDVQTRKKELWLNLKQWIS